MALGCAACTFESEFSAKELRAWIGGTQIECSVCNSLLAFRCDQPACGAYCRVSAPGSGALAPPPSCAICKRRLGASQAEIALPARPPAPAPAPAPVPAPAPAAAAPASAAPASARALAAALVPSPQAAGALAAPSPQAAAAPAAAAAAAAAGNGLMLREHLRSDGARFIYVTGGGIVTLLEPAPSREWV